MPSAYLVNQSSLMSRLLVIATAIIVALLAAWTIVSITMSHYLTTKPVVSDIRVISEPRSPVPEEPAPTPVVSVPQRMAPPLEEPVHVGATSPLLPAAFAEADVPPAPKPREMKTLLDEIRIDPVNPVPLPHPRPRVTEAQIIPMPRPRPDLGEPEFVIEPYIARMQ
jgi:hypothetical protein